MITEKIGKIHSTISMGTVDGPGIRYVVFMQGCPLRCRFCHNPDTWLTNQGTEMTVTELKEDILKYKDFFIKSGGGVTFSGGEPLLQQDFLYDICRELKEEGLNIALDTSGIVPLKNNLLDYIDLVLLDIKHICPEAHTQLTSKSNERVFDFLKNLDKKNIETIIRFVVVHNMNDLEENVLEYARYISKISCVKGVEILPYHEKGVEKWKKLNYNYVLSVKNIPSAERLIHIKETFIGNGLKIF